MPRAPKACPFMRSNEPKLAESSVHRNSAPATARGSAHTVGRVYLRYAQSEPTQEEGGVFETSYLLSRPGV